ncbi:MAG: hypothetical protein U1E05_27335 [Patescibacteria group bacterium]|nr:hypothetical protein [Patescibacteria group bacterium]
MRHCITVPLERHKDLTGSFETEPYECGWAAEAIFFLRVQELTGQDTRLTATVQISADGIHWVDEGAAFPPISVAGDSFVRVSHFGGWLRLAGRIEGAESRMNVMIHLVLKS